jgi:hypothetical protein
MIYKQYEKPHQHFLWQVNPKGKNGSHKQWGIYTTCNRIAANLKKRKASTELQVTFPSDYKGGQFWLFYIEYSAKRKALNSFNNLLCDNSYDPAIFNADMDEYESLTMPHMVDNMEVRVSK